MLKVFRKEKIVPFQKLKHVWHIKIFLFIQNRVLTLPIGYMIHTLKIVFKTFHICLVVKCHYHHGRQCYNNFYHHHNNNHNYN